jgi:hypothetical protein
MPPHTEFSDSELDHGDQPSILVEASSDTLHDAQTPVETYIRSLHCCSMLPSLSPPRLLLLPPLMLADIDVNHSLADLVPSAHSRE